MIVKRKKNIVFALVSAFCICSMGTSFSACKIGDFIKETYLLPEEFTMELSADGSYYILIEAKDAVEMIIPQTHEGKPVKEIGECAFLWCKSMESVVIPEGITTISHGAFMHSNLKSLALPDSLTTIGDSAFQGCNNLTNLYIPDGVTSIEEKAFWGCENLRSVTIGDGVTSIEEKAFWECDNLRSVTIGDGVTSIGDYAFRDSVALSSVVIGRNVTSIGVCAFESRYHMLQSVVFLDTTTWYKTHFVEDFAAKENGEKTDVENPAENAKLFNSEQRCYWYKLEK